MAIYFTSVAAGVGCFSPSSSGPGDSATTTSSAATTAATGASGAGSSTATGRGTTSAGGVDTGSGGASDGGTSNAGATVDCTDLSSTTGTVDTRYGSAQIDTGSGKSYFLQSNWWHTYASETEDYNGLGFTVHNAMDASVPSTDGNPMGFPSIFIGAYGGNNTTGSNLPKQASALTSVPTIYQTNNSAIGLADHNATYDVWFTAQSTPLGSNAVSPGTGGAYLMVWMFKPTNRQPRGNDTGRVQKTVNGVSGTWDVWVDTTNPPCVSYVSHTPIDGLQFDLNDFIQDAVSNGYGVTSSMYLSLVFGGFEIWGGADGLQLQKFCANVK